MTTEERINNILEIKQISKRELAKMAGVSTATIYLHFKNKKREYLVKYLDKLSKIFPDISKEWLYFGTGEMYAHSSLYPIETKDVELLKKSIDIFESELKNMLEELKIIKNKTEILEKKIKNL